MDDPRTLNKTLAFRPPKNIYSFNELVALWEKKIGKTLEKTYVSEEQVLKAIQGKLICQPVEESDINICMVPFLFAYQVRFSTISLDGHAGFYVRWKYFHVDYFVLGFIFILTEAPVPTNIILSINHSVFIKGDQTNYEVDPSWGAEVSELYPDVKYTSVEEYLEQFV